VTAAEARHLWWAMMVARDVETCCALLRGEPVEPGSLDPLWLARAEVLQLVRLDKTAAEAFEEWIAA
jgi:hypothetical protein